MKLPYPNQHPIVKSFPEFSVESPAIPFQLTKRRLVVWAEIDSKHEGHCEPQRTVLRTAFTASESFMCPLTFIPPQAHVGAHNTNPHLRHNVIVLKMKEPWTSSLKFDFDRDMRSRNALRTFFLSKKNTSQHNTNICIYIFWSVTSL